MSSARLRVVRAALLLPLPLVVLLALAWPAPSPANNELAPATPPPEPARLAASHAQAFAFFNEGRASPGTGRGLFETDFFKPPPPPTPPPPPPKPAPPPPKPVSVVYRGFAAFPGDSASVAYLAVNGRVTTLAAGEPVVEGWQLLAFDADGADLARGDERLRLPFNRAQSLPARPAPAKQ